MTKFCPRKVSMKRPMTKMEQMLASASQGVSSMRSSTGSGTGCASVGVLGAGVFFFVILSLFFEWSVNSGQ
jgi:hypothetical protein